MNPHSISHTRRAAVVALFATAAILLADEFTVDWSAVTAGGGQSDGGDFSINATIGQSEAGEMSGGDFELSSGFWSIITALDESGAPMLSVSLAGSEVVLSWPASFGARFALEEANAFPATSWATVNTAPQQTNNVMSVRLSLANGNRFYRLHKL